MVLLMFRVTERDPHAPQPLPFMAGMILFGMIAATIAGVIASKIAGYARLAHSLAITLLIALGAIVSLALDSRHGAIWTQVATLFFIAPSALFYSCCKDS